MNRMDEVNFIRRETPKIGGSSTGALTSPAAIIQMLTDGSAFIVVIVVLVAIIIVSCLAVIYLLRRPSALGDQEAKRRRRYNTQPLGDSNPSNSRHSKKWYSYLWGSRDRHNHGQFDKPATMMGRTSGQGWVQANDREWDGDVDSADERALRPAEVNPSILFRMSERGSPVSSIVGPRVSPPHMHSPTSDTSLSIPYDPHDVRAMPYPEQWATSPQATVPSVHSPLYSPTSSLSTPSSPVPRRTIMMLPEPVVNMPSYELGHDASVQDSLPQSAATVLRTSGSGTKFFESLE